MVRKESIHPSCEITTCGLGHALDGIGTRECVASARRHVEVSASRCSPLDFGKRCGILLRRSCQGVSPAAMYGYVTRDIQVSQPGLRIYPP